MSEQTKPEGPFQATPSAELERQIMDPNVPKMEREWWAAEEITRLRAQIEDLKRLHDDAADTVEEVRAQNAELVEIMRSIVDAWDWWQIDKYDREAPGAFIEDARAAIAKVEKETSE